MGIEKRHELFVGGLFHPSAEFECQGCGEWQTVELSTWDFRIHPVLDTDKDHRPTVEISIQCPVCFTPHVVEFPA